jgi:hypothetical protein
VLPPPPQAVMNRLSPIPIQTAAFHRKFLTSMSPIRPNVRPLPSLLCKTTLFRGRFNQEFPFCLPGHGPIYSLASSRDLFCIGSKAKAPDVLGRGASGPKSHHLPHFKAISRTPPRQLLSVVQIGFVWPPRLSGWQRQSPIRRSMLPNRRRVRWLSANSSQ